MMMSLHTSLRRDISCMLTGIKDSLHVHDVRIQHIETQMLAFQRAHNDVVDSITDQQTEILWLNSIVADRSATTI